MVGVDIGWRLRSDGSLRVAYWVGDDGRHGELVLPTAVVGRRKRVAELASIRDLNYDREKAALVAWLKDNSHPEWLQKRAEYLSQWKSKSRLFGLVRIWRGQRFEGDTAIYDRLVRWCDGAVEADGQKHGGERHLEDWQGGEQERADAQRRDLYRKFAAWLRRQYKTVCLEKVNWREEFQRLPKPEEGDDSQAARHYRGTASPGFLQRTLRQSFGKEGTRECDPKHTTARCHACGHMDAFDAAAELERTCRHCGRADDQDYRAAVNLLGLNASDPVLHKILGTARKSEMAWESLLAALGYHGPGVAFGAEDGASRGRRRRRQMENRLRRRPCNSPAHGVKA